MQRPPPGGLRRWRACAAGACAQALSPASRCCAAVALAVGCVGADRELADDGHQRVEPAQFVVQQQRLARAVDLVDEALQRRRGNARALRAGRRTRTTAPARCARSASTICRTCGSCGCGTASANSRPRWPLSSQGLITSGTLTVSHGNVATTPGLRRQRLRLPAAAPGRVVRAAAGDQVPERRRRRRCRPPGGCATRPRR